MTTFDLNSLNLEELLSNDELFSIDAGASINAAIDMPKGLADNAPKSTPGYTEATIMWSQIP